jgi:acetate kinase
MPHTAVLVLNAGSSSIKAALLQDDSPNGVHRLWHGERTWTPEASSFDSDGMQNAVADCLDPWLLESIAPWRGTLALVAHRVVHGGERFKQVCPINRDVRSSIVACASLAPLHNACALGVIDWLEPLLEAWQPGLQHWACFDTAFHQTLSPVQFSYAIPEAWRAKGLRRYGFHGLNHQHVAQTVQAIWREQGASKAQLDNLKLISAHLGAGCSLCAIQGERSIATSMGLTPLEGLVMASRSGSVDPGLILHLLRCGIADAAELDETLHHRSGLLGLSNLSGDMRTLREAAAADHAGAQLAIDVFTARLCEGIGAMAAVLQGVDVIALTGGIGQNDDILAHTLHRELQWLGAVRLLQIPADEEGQMARQCLEAANP